MLPGTDKSFGGKIDMVVCTVMNCSDLIAAVSENMQRQSFSSVVPILFLACQPNVKVNS